MLKIMSATALTLMLGCTGTVSAPGNLGVGGAGNPAGSGGATDGSGGGPGAGGGVASGTGGGVPAGNGGATATGGAPAGSGGVAPATTTFACNDASVPPATPLRRLDLLQYRNTINGLIAAVAPSIATDLAGTVDTALAAFPDDSRTGPDKTFAHFARLDQAVQQEHVEGEFALAKNLGAALTSTTARLKALAGACATDSDTSNDAACLDAFITSFGARAQRRPLATEDVTFYKQVAGTPPFDAADWADVIALILNSPYVMYVVEHGQDGATGNRVALSAYELASRLSYQFWQTLPDDALIAAAKSGDLLTDAGYQAQVDRLLADTRAENAVGEFFSQWLENGSLEALDSRVGTPVFDAFAGSFKPTADLRGRMIQEVADAALYYTNAGSTFNDFLGSTKSFAKTSDLASIYGVAPWTSGAPPDFADAARVGLIARAAFLATGSANTRPIMKGVFIRKALLCDQIPPPPGNAAANQPPLSKDSSTRQVVQALTGSGVCTGCHTTIINPLGFATENFDALGRFRAKQTLYDEATGKVTGSADLDTTSVPAVDPGDTTMSTGPADLTRLLQKSGKPRACFARQYFRFTFGRTEDVALDACALASVQKVLEDGKPMRDALRALVMQRAFRERTLP